MSWVAVGSSVAGAVVGGVMSNGKSQGGTQTQTKDPWAAAVPWLTHNLVRGEGLQAYYQDNPFNQIQQGAYGNLFRGNDYINQMVPGLLGQMSSQTGFDRNNPMARPAPFRFPTMGPMQQLGGLLGTGSGQMNEMANPWAMASMKPLSGGIPQTAASQPVVGPPQITNPENPYGAY